MTNEELYRQYLSGNAEAFERLYLRCSTSTRCSTNAKGGAAE